MTRTPFHLAGALAAIIVFAPEGLVQEATASDGSADRLPATVDDFFSRALNEGLLPRSDSAALETGQDTTEKTVEFSCPDQPTLDFSSFQELRTHAQLVRFLTGMRGRENGEGQVAPAAPMDSIKAQISLGIYSEVLAQIRGSNEPDEQALFLIARFLQAEGEQGSEALVKLQNCGQKGAFWAAVPRLRQTENQADVDLTVFLAGFRALPFAMKVDVATFLVPDLLDSGQTALANTILATFDEEDFLASAQLRFIRAAMAIRAKDDGAVDELRLQMRHPQFRDEAIRILARTAAPVSLAEVETMRTEIASQFADLRNETDRFALVDFWLTQAHQRNELSIFEDLLAVPSLAEPVLKQKITEGISSHLAERITGGDAEEALTVLDTIMSGGSLSDVARGDTDLMSAAVSYAIGADAPSLAQHLISKSEAPIRPQLLNALRLQQATWAYANGDYQTVLDITLQGTRTEGLYDLAVRSALGSGDQALLNGLLETLSPTPEQALVWIEDETTADREMLPPRILDIATQVQGTRFERRLADVILLRRDMQSAEAAPSSLKAMLMQLEAFPVDENGRG